jgi:hypothetical protein
MLCKTKSRIHNKKLDDILLWLTNRYLGLGLGLSVHDHWRKINARSIVKGDSKVVPTEQSVTTEELERSPETIWQKYYAQGLFF